MVDVMFSLYRSGATISPPSTALRIDRGPGVHPAVPVGVGHVRVRHPVEVLVVVGTVDNAVRVAVVPDEVDQPVVVAVLVDVHAAVRVLHCDIVVPVPVPVGVDVRVVPDGDVI